MASLAGQVGLQLLLTPSTSNMIFKSTSLVMGSAYPVYASFALLESNLPVKEKEQQATQWLTYWAIYGVISAAEQLFESRPPLYYHIKLAFLLWLQNSNYQGARRLYVLFLRPFLQNHKPEVDACIHVIVTFMRKSSVVYIGEHVHNLVARVPYLNWFVEPFNEAKHNFCKSQLAPVQIKVWFCSFSKYQLARVMYIFVQFFRCENTITTPF